MTTGDGGERPTREPWKVGGRVRIIDGSEAHGDIGIVVYNVSKMILVELDSGAVWPVHAHELEAT